MNKLIYISGPFFSENSEDTKKNVIKAIKVGIEILIDGNFPLIPHLSYLFDFITKGMGVEFDYEQYMEWNSEILKRCDAFIFLANSPESNRELILAKKLGIKIFMGVEEYYNYTDIEIAEANLEEINNIINKEKSNIIPFPIRSK